MILEAQAELDQLPTARAVMAEKIQPKLAEYFLAKKKLIEKAGLEQPRESVEVLLPDGSQVRITTSVIDLREINRPLENLQPYPQKKLRIAVMNAGLFEATSLTGFGRGKGNTGNTEVKLAAAGLFAGEDDYVADALVFIKPEGLNDQAYKDGQTAVGTASAIQLEKIAFEYKINHHLSLDLEVEFDLTGFSEGSTQILSTANQILDRKFGSIRRVFSIGGAGFIGAEEIDKADPIGFVKAAIKEARASRKLSKPDGYIDAESHDLNVDQDRMAMIKTKVKALLCGDQEAKKSDKIKVSDDLLNVWRFGWRLLKTKLHLDKNGESVPWKRLKAASSLNPDRAKLAAAGVPMLVYADHDDPFFPPKLIKTEIDRLRGQIPETTIQFVSAALGHYGPHYEQASFSILMEDLSQVLTSAVESNRKINPKI